MKLRKYIELFLIAGILGCMTSCNDWLDVRPESEVGEDQMFSTEQGYMDALYGVYVSMGEKNLYGGEMPLAMDLLMQSFDVPYSSSFENFKTFEYQSPECAEVLNTIWERLYYCVSLTNNILKHLEEETPETLGSYNYLKGECLGLRAFLHYDLLRMFAPNVKAQPDYMSIPYRKDYSNMIDPQLKVSEVFEHIIADLEMAKEILADDIVKTNAPEWLGNDKKEVESGDVNANNESHYMSSFLSDRKYRMNYYAVVATLARVYLDRSAEGDREKAYDYAMEVINSGKYRMVERDNFIVTSENIKKRDALFTDEFIFGLFSTKVDATYAKYCFPGEIVNRFRVVDPLEMIFDSKAEDYRFMMVERDIASDDMLLKKHYEEYENSKQKIRMLTLPEMYYIVSEVKPEQAYSFLDSVAQHRGITCALSKQDSKEDVMVEIMKEYRKEYLGDGQFFFAYKRLCQESFWNKFPQQFRKDNKFLVFPLPESEIEYGDRVSEIWK